MGTNSTTVRRSKAFIVSDDATVSAGAQLTTTIAAAGSLAAGCHRGNEQAFAGSQVIADPMATGFEAPGGKTNGLAFAGSRATGEATLGQLAIGFQPTTVVATKFG